jgi:hypothetical protein
MQYFFIFLLILFFSSPALYAEKAQQPSTDIQKLVAQIKKAPASQKRVLMNQLKVKLREMNEKTRKEVMYSLKSSASQKGQTAQTPQGAQSTSTMQGRQTMPMPQMQQAGGHR